jgi:hypothetical protein
MRHPVFRAILPTLVLLLLVTCNPFGNADYDQTWFVQYTVANQSSVDVTVRYGSYFFYCYKPPVRVPAGQTKELGYYEEFLGAPPDADRCFTCISVYRDSDSLLVFQVAPVRNSQFTRIEHRQYHEQYKLVLTDAKLSKNGLESRCSEIRGSVVDSLTAEPLDFYHVSAHEDTPQSYFIMQTNTGPSREYSLMWYGELPEGSIYFGKQGYRCRQFRVPADAEDLGNRCYRLDADLVPFLPGDSLQSGNCYYSN